MRKRLLAVMVGAVLFAFVGTGTAAAQSLGVKGGLVYSDFQGDDNRVDFSGKAGITAGIVARGALSSVFGIQTELNYERRSIDDPGGSISSDYLAIPVMIQAFFNDAKTNVHVELGTQLAYQLEITRSGSDNVITQAVDIDVETRDWDSGFVAGVGVDLEVDDSILQFDARYYQSVRDLFGESKRSDLRWRTFSVTAAWIF